MFRHQYGQCCGCGACSSACQSGAIVMEIGDDGFYRPKLDKDRCVECGACEAVCPLGSIKMQNQMRQAYLFINSNQYERNLSSSGGFFKCVADLVLDAGGTVYGAAFADDFSIEHVRCEDKNKVFPLLGSKYVQSRIGDTFIQAKKDLEQDRMVLFSGTPCQIAGLKSYLGRDYEKLYTIDVICHGIPSPEAWRCYLEDYHGNEEIHYIDFRYKAQGWWDYGLRIQYAHDEYFMKSRKICDPYIKMFLKGVSLNESCYSCKFRTKQRASDFYIGDAWNINRIRTHMDDNRGVTTVIINSDKGLRLFERLKNRNIYFPLTIDEAVAFRGDLFSGKAVPPQRDSFIKNLMKSGFRYAYEKAEMEG